MLREDIYGQEVKNFTVRDALRLLFHIVDNSLNIESSRLDEIESRLEWSELSWRDLNDFLTLIEILYSSDDIILELVKKIKATLNSNEN